MCYHNHIFLSAFEELLLLKDKASNNNKITTVGNRKQYWQVQEYPVERGYNLENFHQSSRS